MTGQVRPATMTQHCPRCQARMVVEDRYQAGFTLYCMSCGTRRVYQRRAAVVAQNAYRAQARADAMGWVRSIRRGRPRREDS